MNAPQTLSARHRKPLTRSLGTLLACVLLLSSFASAHAPRTVSAQPDAGDDLRFLAGLVERGLNAEAIPAGEAFLRHYGRHADAPVARLYLAEALYASGRRKDALPHFEALARTASFSSRDTARLRFAQCALEYDRAADALTALDRIESSELLPDATRLAARAAYLAGQHKDAQRRYAELARSRDSATRSEANLGLAWIAFDAQEWNVVGEHVDRALRGTLDTAHIREARQLGAEAALARSDSKAALALVETLAESVGSIAFLRGRAFALAKDFEQAERVFEQARNHAAKDKALLRRIDRERGILFAQTGRPERAVEALQHANEPWWLARAELDRGNPEAALRVLERSGKKNEERFAHLHGEVLSALGRTAEALEAYRGAKSVEGLYAALFTAFESQKDQRVTTLADDLIRQFPDDPRAAEAEFLAGECAFRQDRFEQAEQRFARAAKSATKDLATRALRRQLWALSKLARHERLLELGRSKTSDPEIALLVGLSAVASDAPAIAVRAFEAGLRAEPDGARALELSYHLGLVANDERAVQTLTRVANSQATFAPDALLELATRQEGAGHTDRARDAYELFLQRFGKHKFANDARYGLAWSFFDAGDPQSALDALRPALSEQKTPFALSAHELAFWSALRAEQWDACGSSFAVLAERAECSLVLDALRAFAEAATKAEQLPHARRAIKRVVQRKGAFALGARIEHIWLELGQGNLDACEETLRATGDAVSPELGEAAYALGEEHMKRETWDAAERAFKRAEQSASARQPEARYQRAYLGLRRGDARGALGLLQPLLVRAPNDELAPDLKAEALALGVRAADALADHGRVAQLAERFVAHHSRHAHRDEVDLAWGRALHATHAFERAVKILSDLLRRKPVGRAALESQLLRGLSLLELDRRTDASAALQRVVKDAQRDDDLARARAGLASIDERAGRHEAALAGYLKVSILHAHEPSVTNALLSAARLLEAAGDKPSARARLSELLERYPKSPRAAAARTALARL